LGSSACGCNSRRRVGTARSASSAPSEVRSWRARPGVLSARRARTAAAVRSEALGKAATVSDAAALLWARVRAPSAAACQFMRAISSPSESITAVRQLRPHCWVEEDLVALPPRAGAAGAMPANRRRRARVSHVCSRSMACSRHVSARAHVEEAAMGTVRNVEIRVSSRSTRSRPAGRGPTSGERACAGGPCCPGPVPPVPPWSSVVPCNAPLGG